MMNLMYNNTTNNINKFNIYINNLYYKNMSKQMQLIIG